MVLLRLRARPLRRRRIEHRSSQPHRQVGIAAKANPPREHRVVVRSEIGEARKKTRDRDARLKPCQVHPKAQVRPTRESQVTVGGAPEVEPFGVIDQRVVAAAPDSGKP